MPPTSTIPPNAPLLFLLTLSMEPTRSPLEKLFPQKTFVVPPLFSPPGDYRLNLDTLCLIFTHRCHNGFVPLSPLITVMLHSHTKSLLPLPPLWRGAAKLLSLANQLRAGCRGCIAPIIPLTPSIASLPTILPASLIFLQGLKHLTL